MGKTNERMSLLLQLEQIVGSQCYNGNIQNWGPNGAYEGEGREFRYPITFVDTKGEKTKRRQVDQTVPTNIAATGYYAFGANRLHIIQALDKVLKHLEETRGLKL